MAQRSVPLKRKVGASNRDGSVRVSSSSSTEDNTSARDEYSDSTGVYTLSGGLRINTTDLGPGRYARDGALRGSISNDETVPAPGVGAYTPDGAMRLTGPGSAFFDHPGVYARDGSYKVTIINRTEGLEGSSWSPESEPLLSAFWDARDISVDGSVASWGSRSTSFPQTFTQAAGANQPTKGSGYVTFDGTNDKMLASAPQMAFVNQIPVPDAQGSTFGNGFSNNGLCPMADGTFWLSNGGLSREDAPETNRRQSLVHISSDRRTKLHEIDLYTLLNGVGLTAARGVTYRTATDTLLCGWGPDSIAEIADILTGGSVVRLVPGKPCSSLSYSPQDDTIWVLNNSNSSCKKYSLVDLSELEVHTTSETYQDHMFYDSVRDHIVLFCGDNAGPANIVIKDPTTFLLMANISIPGIPGAVEQGCVVGNKLYVNSNAYFHKVTSSDPTETRNRIVELDLPPANWSAKAVSAFAVLKVPGNSGTDFLFGTGQANKIRGWSFRYINSTTLECFMHTGANETTTARTGGNFTVPNMTVQPRILYAEYNIGVGVSLWVDGTSVGTLTGGAAVGNIFSNQIRLSQASDPSMESQMQMYAVGYYNGSADRLKTEGYLAHAHSLQASLPINHPYKSVAP